MADSTNTGAGYTGAGGTVVVIDSGWSATWDDPARVAYQHDFADGDADARNPNADSHGALVTSSILAQAPGVDVIMLKVIPDGSDTASAASIEQALQWVDANAAAYHVVGVNLSLAGGSVSSETTTILSDELASLAAQRVLVSAAAGNAGQNGTATDVSYYAGEHNTICVTSSNGDGALPGWAQRNPGITDICADGTDITLTDRSGRSLTVNGSSFSAPTVTTAVARVQQEATELRGSALTQDEFLSLAHETGRPIGSTGYTDLDTDALLARVARLYGEGEGGTPVADAAATTIVVDARGTAAAGTNAHFTLLVDGQAIGEASVGTEAKGYAFTATLSADGGHAVQVVYDNDTVVNGQDRNLYVESVSINGHAVAATDAGVAYDKGLLDGRDVAAGQTGLWWNGALVIAADKSLFGGQSQTADTRTAEGQTTETQAADSVWSHTVTAGGALDGAAGDAVDGMIDHATVAALSDGIAAHGSHQGIQDGFDHGIGHDALTHALAA